MTIDERLEAITHNIEILMGMQMSNERRFEEIGQRFDTIKGIFETVFDSIQGLENIARAHNDRLEDLEGQ